VKLNVAETLLFKHKRKEKGEPSFLLGAKGRRAETPEGKGKDHPVWGGGMKEDELFVPKSFPSRKAEKREKEEPLWSQTGRKLRREREP